MSFVIAGGAMSGLSTENVYDNYADFYDFFFGSFLDSGRQVASQLADLTEGVYLLELGVGTGLLTSTLPRDVRITGIDFSQKMLGKAKARFLKAGMDNVRLVRMDATELAFPDHSFDRVLAAYFISTVPDPIRVVEEMKRVCRPGGYLVFLNHFLSQNPLIGLFERAFSPLFYRLGFATDLDLSELMEKAKLVPDRVENIDFLGHWKAVRCINPF